MATIKHREVQTFCETGKGCVKGNLVLRGASIFSYDVEIATVDRAGKSISLDCTKYSRTTASHQRAVEIAAYYLGWTLIRRSEGVSEPRNGERLPYAGYLSPKAGR